MDGFHGNIMGFFTKSDEGLAPKKDRMHSGEGNVIE
jgi:hypothetical protein